MALTGAGFRPPAAAISALARLSRDEARTGGKKKGSAAEVPAANHGRLICRYFLERSTLGTLSTLSTLELVPEPLYHGRVRILQPE